MVPFPLAFDYLGPVLAVKGPLCRFAPWTAPDRSGGMAVYEGKGAARACAAYRVVDRGKTPCLVWGVAFLPWFS